MKPKQAVIRVEPKESKWHIRLLLVSAALFLTVQTYLTLAPFLARELPVEVDDAYSYIQKAEQMHTCFLQDCEALANLQEQLLASSDQESVSAQQIRQYHRLFVIYHPLHSVLLLALGGLGFSFETAYMLLAVTTKLFLSAGVVYWFSALFKHSVSTIAVLVLIPVVYIGTGIHTIVPSSMALALALWLWAFVIRRKSNIQAIFIPLSLGMMLFHQAGKLYAGIALGLYILLNLPLMRDRRQQLFVAGIGLLIGVSLLLPYLVTKPQLNFDPTNFYPFHWDLLAEIIPASAYPIDIMTIWLRAFSFPIVGALLLLVGLHAAWQQKRWPALCMAALLTLLAAVSMLYVVPWFGALFFERAWVPLAILLTGFVALGIDAAITQLPAALENLKQRNLRALYRQPVLLAGATMAMLATASITYPQFYARHYGLTLHNQIDRQDFSFSQEQPQDLFSQRILPGEFVLYSHELPLYYYLTYGGLAHGAIFLPVVQRTPEEENWLAEHAEDIRYLAALSPVPERKGIPLEGEVRISAPSTNKIIADIVQIYITSLDADARLDVRLQQGDKSISLPVTIQAGFQGWLELATSVEADEILLSTNTQLHISGLRIGGEQHTHWPWQADILMQVGLESEVTQYDFRPSSLLPDAGFNVEVLDDEGSLILAELSMAQ